ncbi:MAG: DUF4910 domain-containing protein [Acidilobus sp.]
MSERPGQISRALRAIWQRVSEHRVMRYLASITSYNRIQGTIGLVDAARYVQESLLGDAGDSLEVELVKFGGTGVPEWIQAPTGWAIHDARVSVGGNSLTLEVHPTLAVAHSPPSGGVVSGEAVVIDRGWWRPEAYTNAKGKIVVSPGNPYIVYRLSLEAGAAGVALYTEGAHGEAVPYKGLFLSRAEAANFTIPAVSLPRSLAESLRGGGRSISITVDADVRRDPGFPIVVAWIGDREKPGPALVAHVCHPTPSANDNGSGAAALMEAAVVLSRLVDSGEIQPPSQTLRFIWVPEYTGSSVVLSKNFRGLVTDVINFDMVGAEPGDGNGPIRVVSSSASTPGVADASLFEAVQAVSDLSGFSSVSLVQYEPGSDHDIAAALGIPSAMLNGWPHRFYHTDLDDLDSVSRRALGFSSAVAALSAFIVSSTRPDPTGFRQALLERLVLRHLANGDEVAARLAGSVLASVLGVQPLSTPPEGYPVKVGMSVKLRPPIIESTRWVARRSLDAALRIAELIQAGGQYAAAAYQTEGVFLLAPDRDLGEVAALVAAEYGDRWARPDWLVSYLELLADIKLVELS